jgi:propanol-preferring alcohol dehydrogenase
MRALTLSETGAPLRLADLPEPALGERDVLIQVEACGVCRTDLHIQDGELPPVRRPLVPGHQIVGTVVRRGQGATRFEVGTRVGVPWLGWTCGRCPYCARGEENLCDEARFTGYHRHGGFAELAAADERFCLVLPKGTSAVELAPLLCAGLIGYRTLSLAGDAQRVGIYGFGAAAHIVTQVAHHQRRRVFAFTRPQDDEGQRFALDLGVEWAGSSSDPPPEELDAALIFAPSGPLVPQALRAVRKGGVVVCGGIHMSDIPAFPYELLWGERVLRSVANLTRRGGEEFLALVPRIPVRAQVAAYPFEAANQALADLRYGRVRGAAVLDIGRSL